MQITKTSAAHARLHANKTWIAHFWPLRFSRNESASGPYRENRATLRWHIQNAKINRWLAGGRYPSNPYIAGGEA